MSRLTQTVGNVMELHGTQRKARNAGNAFATNAEDQDLMLLRTSPVRNLEQEFFEKKDVLSIKSVNIYIFLIFLEPVYKHVRVSIERLT